MKNFAILSALAAASGCGTVVKNPKAPPPSSNRLDLTQVSSSVFDEVAESMLSPEATVPATPAALQLSSSPAGYSCKRAGRGVLTHFTIDTEDDWVLRLGSSEMQQSLQDHQVHDHTWTPLSAGAVLDCAPSGRLGSTWGSLNGTQLTYNFTLDDSVQTKAKDAGSTLYRRAWAAQGARLFTVTGVATQKTALKVAFTMTSDVRRGPAEAPSALHLTSPQALSGSFSRDPSTGAAQQRAIDSGRLQGELADGSVLQVDFAGLRYDSKRLDACWPVEGNAVFTLNGAATTPVTWTFDFGTASSALPRVVSSDGREVEIEPGFCPR